MRTTGLPHVELRVRREHRQHLFAERAEHLRVAEHLGYRHGQAFDHLPLEAMLVQHALGQPADASGPMRPH